MKRHLIGLAALVCTIAAFFTSCPQTVDTGTEDPNDLVAVTGVTVSSSSITLATGSKGALGATVYPSNAANKSLGWSSSAPTIADVSASGVVSAKAVGSATITVTTNDGGKKAVCTVTVAASVSHVASIDIAEITAIVYTGATRNLFCTLSPNNATEQGIVWSSSDNTVATVNSNGIVTGKTVGTATITATSVDGAKTDTCTVTVRQGVSSVNISQTSATVVVGQTLQLNANVLPANAYSQGINWSVSYSSQGYLSVSDSGLVRALQVGTGFVYAESEQGDKTALCTITVVNPSVQSISLSKTSVNLPVGGNAQLSASVIPFNADVSDLIWTSSNDSVASVVNGLITAKSNGDVTITATADGKSASCSVHVFTNGLGINFVGTEDEFIDLSSDKSMYLYLQGSPNSLSLSVAGSYSSYAWYVNTVRQIASDDDFFYDFYANEMGVFTVTVVVTRDGVPYSKSVKIRVMNAQ